MAVNDCCLIVFANEPVPGKVKKRLSSELGKECALVLYKAFLKDTQALVKYIPVHFRILAYESFGGIPQYLYSAFPHFIFYPQHGADLGMRIQDAVLYAKHMGADRIVIIGSDAPTLPPQLITESFERLKKYDVVLGPCIDGGFYLIGLQSVYGPVFKDVSWSGGEIFKQLKKNVEQQECSCYTLCHWHDIDHSSDLCQLFKKRAPAQANFTMKVVQAMKRDIFTRKCKD